MITFQHILIGFKKRGVQEVKKDVQKSFPKCKVHNSRFSNRNYLPSHEGDKNVNEADTRKNILHYSALSAVMGVIWERLIF